MTDSPLVRTLMQVRQLDKAEAEPEELPTFAEICAITLRVCDRFMPPQRLLLTAGEDTRNGPTKP